MFSLNSFAADLKCSANGTFIFHIPGAYTSSRNQVDARNILNSDILFNNSSLFDLKKQNSNIIGIASQGLIQDKFTYIFNSLDPVYRDTVWMASGILELGFNLSGSIQTMNTATTTYSGFAQSLKTGVKGSERIKSTTAMTSLFSATTDLAGSGVLALSASNNNKTLLENLATGSTGVDFASKALTVAGLGNLSSLQGFAMTVGKLYNLYTLYKLEGNFFQAIDQASDSTLAAYYLTQNNVNNIAKEIKLKIDDNQKVILSVHGEGNQLASRAISQIMQDGTKKQKSRLTRLVSVLATSPTNAGYSYKYLYMKHNYDNRSLGGSSVMPNYVLNKSLLIPISDHPDLWDLSEPSNSYNNGSDFLKYYISQTIKGTGSSGHEEIMRDNYIAKLRESAESLEDNCPVEFTFCNGGDANSDLTVNIPDIETFSLSHIFPPPYNYISGVSQTCDCHAVKLSIEDTIAIEAHGTWTQNTEDHLINPVSSTNLTISPWETTVYLNVFGNTAYTAVRVGNVGSCQIINNK